jgi:hypothetical protein
MLDSLYNIDGVVSWSKVPCNSGGLVCGRETGAGLWTLRVERLKDRLRPPCCFWLAAAA